MEKQLVEEFNKTNKLSEMDEVSRDMILARAYKFSMQLARFVHDFTKAFHSLVDSEPELSKLIEPTLLLSYTEYVEALKKPEEPVPVILVTGSTRLVTLSLSNLAKEILNQAQNKGEENDVQEKTVQEG